MEEYEYIELDKISVECLNKKIMLDGRVHNIRNKKNVGFVILRNGVNSIQCVLIRKQIGDNKYTDICNIPSESYVKIYGKLNELPENVVKIESCGYNNFELIMDDCEIVSKSYNILPFQIDEANNDDDNRKNVLLSTKLDNRWFDLRTPINNCIFKLQSGICELFRNYLLNKQFMEIHTPKLTSVASESGAQVFEVKYFNKMAYLAQSPQLYKQMCINSDFDKVFEIGSVFRAENANSHRHLTEFMGMDVELVIPPNQNYYYIVDLLWDLLRYIYTNLKIKYQKEYDYVKKNHKFDDLVFPQKPLLIDYKKAAELLNENGFVQNSLNDLSTENERELGKIVKRIYNSDLFILDKFPASVRPFYTMISESDTNYTNSYDLIMRGEEICSGAQRIHDYQMLKENINKKNINEKSLEDYIKSFENGSKPHGGFGLGLERILMLILDLKNVRKSSLYPRDPIRLTP